MSTTRSAGFDKWFSSLKDATTRARIAKRIVRLEAGNPGDVRPIGRGASELRFTFGPGYRVYYLQEGDDIVLLLGGDKSTQSTDIAHALGLLEDSPMPLKKDVATASYDFAEYIHTAEDARATITVAFEDGDPAVITKMLGAVARSKGMSALAEETGLTRASLYKSLTENGNPLFSTVAKVVEVFDLELSVQPKRKGPGPAAPKSAARSKNASVEEGHSQACDIVAPEATAAIEDQRGKPKSDARVRRLPP